MAEMAPDYSNSIRSVLGIAKPAISREKSVLMLVNITGQWQDSNACVHIVALKASQKFSFSS